MQRVIENVVNAPLFNDTPGIHHNDFIGEFCDNPEVVRNQHNRHPHLVLEFLHECQHLCLDGNIKGSCRFIGDEERGRATECHRNHDALPHAARELMRVFINALRGRGDTNAGEHLNSTFARRPLINPLVQPHRLCNLIADGVNRVEGCHRLLENNSDFIAADLAHQLAFRRDLGDVQRRFIAIAVK